MNIFRMLEVTSLLVKITCQDLQQETEAVVGPMGEA